MPPNTLRVHTEYVLVKSMGPKVLWAESRVQGTGEYFPPLQSHGKIVEVDIGSVTHLSSLRGNFAEIIRTLPWHLKYSSSVKPLQSLVEEEDRVSPNVAYKLGKEVEKIVRRHNYIGKHGRKTTGGAEREFQRSKHVVFSFQTCTACDEHESLYEHRVGGHPLPLRPSQRKWTYCCLVVWGKIFNEVAIDTSNVPSGASEPGGTWIFQIHD
ncbi:uncharacterized protein TNCV_3657201 [Trichonephila clavipes]|nr:uncharacterized protein TNCV_3657201 [Trichonephila clavipes]